MANSSKKIFFSDLIGSSYKDWERTQIIFDGGTGTGKTYFILNRLGNYAKQANRKILYLCNRSELKYQICCKVKQLRLQNTIWVMTYQDLQNKLKSHKTIPYYEYIIADECHYFTNDALFNEYTDLSYKYLEEQKACVVIYISATAKVFFNWIKRQKQITDDHYFLIAKDYSYVHSVCFYEKKQLIPKIDEILETEGNSKIIVFCNSIDRMLELHKKYGDLANYCASKNASKVKDICEEKSIYEHPDGTVTFDKRILIATKVLDNGIDIKDAAVKHIFSEILDADSAIQALGRKRKISENDTCTFYLKNYSGQAIQGMLNTNDYQLDPVIEYRVNYPRFVELYGQNRKRIRNNKIFYTKFADDRENIQLAYNEMRFNKYLMDNIILNDMKEKSYKNVMVDLLGSTVSGKINDLDIHVDKKDEFLEYLKSIEGKWLYDTDRKEITKRFELIGLKLRREGINTLNGALEDNYKNKYKCRFRNKYLDDAGKLTKTYLVDNRKVLPDGSLNKMRNKMYWILE